MCNSTANKFHKVMLHGETLVFVTTAIVATVAEVESGSTFGSETCLATKVQIVSRNRPCYTVQRQPKHVSNKFQRVTAALDLNLQIEIRINADAIHFSSSLQ